MNFKKSNLKSGMIVKLRTGELFCYFFCHDNLSFLFNKREMIPISFYNNDLTSWKSQEEDIIEVHKIENNPLENLAQSYHKGTAVFTRKTDWSKALVDSKVLFWDGKSWQRGYFAKYENESVYIFAEGATSWSNSSELLCMNPNDVALYADRNEETDLNSLYEYRDIEGFSNYKVNVKGDVIRKEFIRDSVVVPESKVHIHKTKYGASKVILFSDKGIRTDILLMDLIAKVFSKNNSQGELHQ